MGEAQFWGIVETTIAKTGGAARRSKVTDAVRRLVRRTEAEGIVAARVKTLSAELRTRSDDDLRDFAVVLAELQERAYRWDLWAAGYLALGGLGDDSFIDFRSWLISQGREVFERVLASPDSLVELSWDEEEEDFAAAEAWGYAVFEEWDRRHDAVLEVPRPETSTSEPTGEPFPEDDEQWYRDRFPRLAKKYL